MKVQKLTLARRSALPLLLAGSLMIAGCTGDATPSVPAVENTEAIRATEPVAATEMPTVVPTVEATTAPEGTAPETQQPAATLEGTAPAAVGTPGAGETAMPGVNDVEEVLVQASHLVGMELQALDGLSLGTIRDVLVDQTGNIKFIVVELPAIASGQPQNVVLDWTALQTVVQDTHVDDADLENVTLNFSGTAQDLADALPILMNEDLDAIITSAGTDLPEELNHLVSLAQVNTLALQDTADEQLGQLEDALVDLRAGTVDYVVLDLSATGGLADTTVMVPWEKLTVDPAQAAAAQAFVLDVTQSTLQNAPPIDLSELPTFIDPRQLNWETIQDFWDNLS